MNHREDRLCGGVSFEDPRRSGNTTFTIKRESPPTPLVSLTIGQDVFDVWNPPREDLLRTIGPLARGRLFNFWAFARMAQGFGKGVGNDDSPKAPTKEP